MKTCVEKRELRQFGITMAIFIVLVFGLLLPYFYAWINSIYAWCLAAVFMLMATLSPQLLAPVLSVWMKFADVLAIVNTHIILFVVYLLLFIPIGLALKLVRYDPLARGAFAQSTEPPTSYRIERKTPLNKSSLENPF